MQFSRRANWQAPVNRLTRVREERRAGGHAIFDLTVSNPTRAALTYPLDELAEVMREAARQSYDAQPLGTAAAREAVARHERCDPADVMITASTSEAYAFLFKLLTDPGDEVVTAVPSYPLLEHLAAMELVTLRTFPLEFHRRWELTDPQTSARTRAIALVSPNNPTGSFVQPEEIQRLAQYKLPLIIDAVFADYPLDAERPQAPPPDGVLAFTMGGLSKSAGLPHYKLGWIRVSGPASQRHDAIAALELIGDHFLSVSTPVQAALPALLRIGAEIRRMIQERLRSNLALVRESAASHPSVAVLPVEGGWSAVLRLPSLSTDEELALRLLDAGVVIHPGYFFDFQMDGFIVVSLLTPPDVMGQGLDRMFEVIAR